MGRGDHSLAYCGPEGMSQPLRRLSEGREESVEVVPLCPWIASGRG